MVTGVSGFIGQHLAPALVRSGHSVTSVSRSDPESDLAGAECVIHLAGLAHDNVGQSAGDELIAVNARETLALYQRACTAGVRRFVWLSSIKVLGDEATTPLRTDSPCNPQDLYAESKAEGERLLAETEVDATTLTIVRPPLVYGTGVKANFRALLDLSLARWPLPLGGARAPRAWVSVRNLVDFLIHLVDANEPPSGIWHVRDEHEASVAEVIAQIRDAAGQPIRLVSVNPDMLYKVMTLAGREAQAQRMLRPLRVDMEETIRSGWNPPFRMEQEIREVVEWRKRR